MTTFPCEIKILLIVLLTFYQTKVTEMTSRLAHRVFVYGTLKRGQPNYFRFQDSAKYGQANFLGEAKLTKTYPMVIASRYNIPMVLDKEGHGKVSPKVVSFLHPESCIHGGKCSRAHNTVN